MGGASVYRTILELKVCLNFRSDSAHKGTKMCGNYLVNEKRNNQLAIDALDNYHDIRINNL